MIQARWSQNILLGLLVVILVLLGLWGFSNGVDSAKARRVLKDAKVLTEGFTEFKKDQNRFPSTGEFEDNNLMRNYVTNFPPQQFPDALCEKSFDYFSGSSQEYELRFCLPKAVSGYQLGWNTLTPQ
jgi:type II secretory pathway pseudopilin PulG